MSETWELDSQALFDLQNSPVRQNIARLDEDQLSIFELEQEDGKQMRTILRDVENMLGAIAQNSGKKTNIAVMGEVKAGKSTFLNACLGREAAYTDILEATVIVSEIGWAEQEFVRVLGKDGAVKHSFTFEELMDWMEDMVDEEADFSPYSKIEAGLPCPLLENLVFVDTPGLLSITSENHEVTNQYIAQTDYVLWVLNSRNLGSKRVNEYIEKVKLSGKPVIGILNKVDSAEEKQEIEDYVGQVYGNTFEEIFYTSASQAWRLRQDGDPDWAEKTGFDGVLECIGELAEDKQHSTRHTQYFQLQRDLELHRRLREIIHTRKEFYDREIQNYQAVNHEIQRTVSEELRSWLRNELYAGEQAALLGVSGAEWLQLADEYSREEYLNAAASQKFGEIASFISRKWEHVVKSLSAETAEIEISFDYRAEIPETGDAAPAAGRDVVKTAVNGAARGAIAGLALAGYEAILGPAAAVVSLPMALPMVLPLTLIGAGISVVWSRKENVKRMDQVREDAKARKKVSIELREKAQDAVRRCLPEMEKQLCSYSDAYCAQRIDAQRELVRQLRFDFDEPAYGKFMQAFDQYLTDLESAAAAYAAELEAPPEMD